MGRNLFADYVFPGIIMIIVVFFKGLLAFSFVMFGFIVIFAIIIVLMVWVALIAAIILTLLIKV